MSFLRRRHAACLCVWMLLLGAVSPAAAQSDQPPVPDTLQPWVDWVLYDEPDLACPQVEMGSGQRVCEWPGTLEVTADDDGARFVMQVWLARTGDVRLPGSQKLWPQRVRADGRPAVVKQAGGSPVVELDAGAHRLSGEFEWTSVPEVLPAPASLGHVTLELRGAELERPRLDANGRLWMDSTEGAMPGGESDSIRTSIYRRLEDGSPLKVITQLELNVSGKAREIDMGEVLVAGSRATAVESPLPVEIDAAGSVSVYARPGTHRVVVEAVMTERTDKLAVPEPGPDFYDPQEVWVWIPDEVLRTVELDGLQTVDPARTSLPEAWRGHTTFLAEPNEALELEVTRRGKTSSPNAVHLDRQLWLDVDGDGFTIRDHLSGTLQRDWRLDYAGRAELGRVYDKQDGSDVLITESPQSGRSGVELRQSTLGVAADLRLDSAAATLPAVGWDHDVQQLSASVNLPPGWTLLGASGVDQVDGTWLDSWTLWDFFFVLIVALAIGKLLGWRWTFVGVLALVASHGHAGAPMWVWIHLIASLALLRALPDGWWRKGVYVYRTIALLVLFGVLASFAHVQVRAALHPQVNSQAFRTGDAGTFTSTSDQKKYSAASAPVDRFAHIAEDSEAPQADGAMKKKAEHDHARRSGSQALSSYAPTKLDLKQVDPKAVVQTGPGMPSWSWNSWRLTWNGPVHKEHQMRLWLVSPMVNRLLTFLRVALLIVLALLVLAPRDMRWKKDDETAEGSGGDDLWRKLTQTSVALLVGMAALAAGPDAFAQTGTSHAAGQDQAMLETLRKRLVAAQQCDGICVLVSRADIEVDGLDLTMRAEVHAQKDAGWHLPGPADPLRIESVEIDGLPTTQFRREPGGLTAVRVPEGRHTVEISGRLANRNVVTLQFNARTRPKKVSFDSDAWTVDGLSPTGAPDSSLQLTRTDGAATPEGPQKTQELPPWYHVERFVGLGLPWKVRTTVTRADASRPQLVKIPLIDGESVTTDGMRVKDGEVHVDLPRGQSVAEYTSELPIREQVELTAPADQPWSETWTVECSRIWRCHFSDLPPVELVDPDKTYRPTWKPWPSETLAIDVERPAGAAGQSTTVDNVEYRVTPGKRLLEASLRLTIRASQGGSQTLTLPEGAELQTTQIDDSERSLRLADRKLDLPIRPGEHTYFIEWQQPWERDLVERVPPVDIGAPAANVAILIERSQERWLLRATGPQWGPAIMFWAHLVILLLIAVLLSRLRGLPLRLHDWMLLVIGMSQLPYVALIPIVAWFALLRLRKKSPPKAWWKFDLAQLCIIGLTVAASLTLYAAVHTNLLIDVDMQVAGAKSSDHLLRWYVDRTDGALATPAIVSVPILVWRLTMLAWAFWLVSRLLTWVPWGWSAFSEDGLWRSRGPRTPDTDGDPTAPSAPEEAQKPQEMAPEPADEAPDEEKIGEEETGEETASEEETGEEETGEEHPEESEPHDAPPEANGELDKPDGEA